MKFRFFMFCVLFFCCGFAVAKQDTKGTQPDDITKFRSADAQGKISIAKSWVKDNRTTHSSEIKQSLLTIRQQAVEKGDKQLQQQSNIALSNFSSPDTAMLFLEEALRLDNMSHSDSVLCFTGLNECYRNFKMLPKVLDTYYIVSQLTKNDTALFSGIVLGMARMYLDMGYYHEAITHFNLNYSMIPEKGQMTPEANHFNDLGFIYYKMGMNDSALYYFNRSAVLVDSLLMKNTNSYRLFFKGLVRGNIGSVYKTQRKYTEAIPLLREDIDASMDYPNFSNALNSLLDLTECYEAIGEMKQAAICLDSAEALIKHKPTNNILLRFYKIYSSYYEKTGDKIRAYDYLSSYQHLSDSLAAIDKQQLLHVSSIIFNAERKDADAFRKTANVRVGAVHRKWIIIASGIISVLLVVIMVLVNRNRKLRVKNSSH